MSQISQLSKLAITIFISVTVTVTLHRCPSHKFPVTKQPNHVVCHIILWLVGVVPFSTNRKGSRVFFACKCFLLADTVVREACLYRLFLLQMRRKRDSNVSNKECRFYLAYQHNLKTGIWFEGYSNTYIRTKTHWGSVSLQRRLKLVTWFGRAGASKQTIQIQIQSRTRDIHF